MSAEAISLILVAAGVLITLGGGRADMVAAAYR